MGKKLITACMALFALAAFILPASASAVQNVTITHPTGTKLAKNVKITGTNVGNTKFSAGIITVECNSAVFTGTLTKNSEAATPPEEGVTETAGTIETAAFTGTGTGTDCTPNGFPGPYKVTTNVGNGVPFCIFAKSNFAGADEVRVRGNSCGAAERSVTFVLDATSLGSECKYERKTVAEGGPGPIVGTYDTDTGASPSDAIITLKNEGTKTTFVGEASNNFSCPGNGSLEMSITLETDVSPAAPLWFS